jgi:transcriptional regulator with XRE-family HTH domain
MIGTTGSHEGEQEQMDQGRSDRMLGALGAGIRERRQSLGLTLKDVEGATGISHPFLSKIERGLSRPSMRTLTLIADVLDTTAHALVALSSAEDFGGVQRRSALEVEHSTGMARFLVRGAWPFLPVEYRSGPSEFEEYYTHAAREMIYVATGRCEMEVEGHGIFKLGAGESLFYGGHVKHRWRQLNKGSLRVLLIQESLEATATLGPDQPERSRPPR